LKILFDTQIFNNQKFGGISRYFTEIITGIKLKGHQAIPKKIFADNLPLRQNALSKLDLFTQTRYFRGKARINNLIEKYQENDIASKVKGGNYDIFHPTYYDPRFLDYKPKNKPFVLTVHDMIHELQLDNLFGCEHKETTGKKILIPEADHIIAVSQSTKQDILTLFPSVPEDKITVIHHGNPLENIQPAATNTFNPDYFLYVGMRNSYKNFNWLIKAISGYLIENELHLICAGGYPFSAEELKLIELLKLKGKIHFAGIECDSDLCALYKNAKCLIIPSLYEGFGMPILEAFSCDCPVLANASSSLPEIAGPAAIYFDAKEQDTILRGLDEIQQKDIRDRKLTAGKDQLKKFSWEKSVDQHIEVYRRLLNKTP